MGYAGNLTATTKAIPLGKVASPQAMTEGVLPGKQVSISAGNLPAMPKAPSQRELAKPSGFD